MNRENEPITPHLWRLAGLALTLAAITLAATHLQASAESQNELAVRPEALLAMSGEDIGDRVVVAGTLRSSGASRWQVEWRGVAISISPRPEILDRFDTWSRWAVDKEILIEGRLQRESGETRVDFWIYEFPREFEEEIVDVPLVTVMDLMTDADTYSGRLVRVRGVRIQGNGHLSADSRRDEADWVLRDDCCDLWVSGASGRPSAGARGKSADERLDVVGRADIAAGLVHLVAENVVPAPPEMPARIKLQVTGESGEGFPQVCGKALVRVTILGDVPQVPLTWTLYVGSEERSTGAVPFLYEGVLKREHDLIEHVLFEHFLGAFMSDRSSQRDRLNLDTPGNTSAGEARRLIYELILTERDNGRVVASDRTRTMVDCLPPLCSPSSGCRQ